MKKLITAIALFITVMSLNAQTYYYGKDPSGYNTSLAVIFEHPKSTTWNAFENNSAWAFSYQFINQTSSIYYTVPNSPIVYINYRWRITIGSSSLDLPVYQNTATIHTPYTTTISGGNTTFNGLSYGEGSTVDGYLIYFSYDARLDGAKIQFVQVSPSVNYGWITYIKAVINLDTANYLKTLAGPNLPLAATISRLQNDSARLTADSISYLSSINKLKTDSISKNSTITRMKNDSVSYVNSIVFLKNDTTAKGILISQLQIVQHDSVYIQSSVTSDTLLIIKIHTGISTASPVINKLTVYPNPTSDYINISWSNPNNYKVFIINTSNITVGTASNNQIDVRTLADGIYYLIVTDGAGKNIISANAIQVKR